MRDPQALMSTEQFSSLLGQPNLRIYDCTTYLEPPPPGNDDPYVTVPGRRTFEEAHIPGADFLDLQGEFSDVTTRLKFRCRRRRSSKRPSAVTGSRGTVASCSTASGP